jgi:hypothetical protein
MIKKTYLIHFLALASVYNCEVMKVFKSAGERVVAYNQAELTSGKLLI